MKIISFQLKELREGGWEIEPIVFHELNLLVGASGAGKTRIMNSIFNIASFIATNQFIGPNMECKIIIGKDDLEYTWNIQILEDNAEILISRESLIKKDLKTQETTEVLKRDKHQILYNKTNLPKLDSKASLLFTLREEDDLKDVVSLFNKIIRRNFFGDELQRGMSYQNIPIQLEQEFKENKSVFDLLNKNLSINGILYLLYKYNRPQFNLIAEYFKEVFDNITECGAEVIDNKKVAHKTNEPLVSFWMKEKNVHDKIFSQDMSSGMQKVLMIITDIITLPNDVIYLVDEYENSLGVNAIDFLPSLLIDFGAGKQIVITTHHPYLINKIPIKDWLLITRYGSKVSSVLGIDLAEKYGDSRQDSFIQLTNDPLYTMEN